MELSFMYYQSEYKNHKDLEDVCHRWYAVVVMSNFEWGDAYFAELRVNINCSSGT